MVKALVEINDIDNGDDVADVLHGADDYAMNGTFVERKVLRWNSSLNDSTSSTTRQTCFSPSSLSPSHQSTTKLLKKWKG